MKAKETMVLEFLQNSSQFIIPIYQRTYSWELEQCQQLWDDVIRAGKSNSASVHFVGSIVYVADGLSTVSLQAPLLVIDGQQRLTTITLLLEALQRSLGETEPVEGFSAEKIKSRYLTRHLEKGEKFSSFSYLRLMMRPLGRSFKSENSQQILRFASLKITTTSSPRLNHSREIWKLSAAASRN